MKPESFSMESESNGDRAWRRHDVWEVMWTIPLLPVFLLLDIFGEEDDK